MRRQESQSTPMNIYLSQSEEDHGGGTRMGELSLYRFCCVKSTTKISSVRRAVNSRHWRLIVPRVAPMSIYFDSAK